MVHYLMCKKVYLIILLLTVISQFGRSIKFNNLTDFRARDKTFREVSYKYILNWPYELGYMPPAFRGRDIFHNCPVNTCYVTRNVSFLKSVTDFDAIFFYSRNTLRNIPQGIRRDPEYRSSHQKYIFISDESSHKYPTCHPRYDDSYFNWTFTYKLDSDGYYGFIIIRNSKGEIIGPNHTMHWMKQESMDPVDNKLKLSLSSKTKAAAWLDSKCSPRSNGTKIVILVRAQLQKYGLDLDIFGGCSSKQCGTRRACFERVRRDYYFYFAVESSNAEDWVTETLLDALRNDAIPVVFGGANYTRFMPNGMYLDAGSMEPRELAKEMRNIIRDRRRYYGFFRWRNHYSYHDPLESPETSILCRTCAMLANERQIPTTTMKNHFIEWWNDPKGRVCIFPNIKNFGRKLFNLLIKDSKRDTEVPWKLFGILLFGGMFWLPHHFK